MDQPGGGQLDFEAPVRVPGTHPPNWIPDNEVSSCQLCNIEFTLMRRRHHCRSCGKIFCSECCHLKARLPYMNNKEARVCDSCLRLLAITLAGPSGLFASSPNASSLRTHAPNQRLNYDLDQSIPESNGEQTAIEAQQSSSTQQPSTSSHQQPVTSSSQSPSESTNLVNYNQNIPIQGVLKTSSTSRNRAQRGQDEGQTLTGQQQPTVNKQVIFSDGIRPGTDLCESTCPMSGVAEGMSSLERRHRHFVKPGHKSRRKKSGKNKEFNLALHDLKHVTLSDQLGFLPPIVIEPSDPKNRPTGSPDHAVEGSSSFSSVFGQDIAPDLDLSSPSRNHDHTNGQEQNLRDNQVGSFAELSRRVGDEKTKTVKFILLKNFYIYAKIIDESCCMRKNNIKTTNWEQNNSQVEETSNFNADNLDNSNVNLIQKRLDHSPSNDSSPEFWYFRSEGLAPLGQNEVVFILGKPSNENSLPRDVFKLYLTIHELSLRGQAFGNLGNLLFTDGLFGNKDIAGVIFSRPLDGQCFENLILPKTPFLVAILIQRWEVPWSKVFPLRLLLRLGIEYRSYPYMIASLRDRPPVYYEVGHTIIGILADLRNYRYSVESVPRMGVVVDKEQERVIIEFPKSYYQQVMKVLSNSNNEHVLSWMSDISSEATSHLVSVQNDDGQHDTQVFTNNYELCDITKIENHKIGASFVIFSGALKASQPGQTAKISVVEDGLLIQIQSHTLSALRNSIQSMSEFNIETGVESGKSDMIKSLSVVWISNDDIPTEPYGVKSPIDGQTLDQSKNIRVQNSADYVGERYFIRWTDVFLSKNEQDLNEIDVSRLAEEVAQSFCFSMTKHLDRLIEEGRDLLALRLILNESIDEIGFDVGSNGCPLPLSYIRDLDATILPVISSISGSMNLVIELFFYILRT